MQTSALYLYIFNGTAINNLQNALFSKNNQPISNPQFYLCLKLCCLILQTCEEDTKAMPFSQVQAELGKTP